MKVKLSKQKWIEAGRASGWIKTSYSLEPDPLPVTGKYSKKMYQCEECGYKALRGTNHWGECYPICDKCHKRSRHLEKHRVKPGWEGGEYVKENIRLLCPKCHKIVHQVEFGQFYS